MKYTAKMEYRTKWIKLISLLAPGVTIASCMTDVRDATMSGAMDAVSGTISNAATAMFPIGDFIGRIWTAIFTNMGL